MPHPRLKLLADQVMLITGASSGIGLAAARAAARKGAKLMLVSRDGETLAGIVREIENAGGTAAYAVADVGEYAQLRAAADAALACYGRIDSWVSNAGVAIYAPLLATPLDEHERLFRTNYFGAVHSATIACEAMGETGGTLIVIGSIAGEMPSPVLGAYAASKHAVHGFVESLRIELRAAGSPIQVTLVKPSGINTPIGLHAANHLPGEALAPQPVYDVALVAKTVLDAAEHPRREVTVGGLGRLLVLGATHFPRLFERLAPAAVPLMHDPARPKPTGDNLAQPAGPHRERSYRQGAIPIAPYTSLARHRLATAMLAAGLTGLALARRARRRRRTVHA